MTVAQALFRSLSPRPLVISLMAVSSQPRASFRLPAFSQPLAAPFQVLKIIQLQSILYFILENSPAFFTALTLATAFAFAGGLAGGDSFISSTFSAFATFSGTSTSSGFAATRFRPRAGGADALLVDG